MSDRCASRGWCVAVAALLLLCGGFAEAAGAEDAPTANGDLPVVFEETFEAGTDAWEPTDAAAWKTVDGKDGKAFNLHKKSNFKPPHRSPLNIALHKGADVGAMVLDADVQSTGKDRGHRDLCFFFGYQDPAHFYYVHIAKQADDHANQIFLVDGADRTKISTKSTAGTNWDDEWHHVRVVRQPKSGEIAIYFDDMDSPIMTATDKTFAHGRVGIGSFDDTGKFDNVTLHGTTVTADASK